MLPSTRPSTVTFSSPVISPLILVLAPITQVDVAVAAAGAAGAGAGRAACVGGATGEGAVTGRGVSIGLLSVLPKIPISSSGGAPSTRAGAERLERATGFEPATPSLGSSYSTN